MFKNNSAILGGGAIYIFRNFQQYNFTQNNLFEGNNASYGKDVASPPVRLRFANNTNNKENFTLSIIPGISRLDMMFEMCDFYGNIVNTFIGRSLIFFFFFSYNFLVIP